jgi:hypothetical protein
MVRECVVVKSSVLLCVFCGQKHSIQRILIKKTIPVYGGYCDIHLFGPLKNILVANVSLMMKRLKRRYGSG